MAPPKRLWESIVADASANELAVCAESRELLDDRVHEDDEDPDAAIPWPAPVFRALIPERQPMR